MTEMGREEEQALVARLRAGDVEAFDDVYDLYRPRVFAFLLRMTRRRALAEDLLDETWLRLVGHAPALEGETRLAPWLFTVARNLYWSYGRGLAVEESYAPDLLSLWPAPQPWPSPFELAAASELEPDATVAAAFARLGTYDVAPARARRLRDRCHARLRARRAPDPSFDIPDGTLVRRLIGPALVGVWCLVYLIAILRFAAAVYGFEGI
jgi:DNA-directed RNA polymerase specialized sigma24 family protein